MIKRYCDIVPILRPMIAYIKRWAKPLGLNSPSMTNGPQSFSSYALVLMTISYLQSQGLAPNLQSRLLRSSDSSTGFFWILSKTGRSSRVDTRYHLGRGWTAKETTSYEDALSGWFHYWGYEHGYSTMVASIREGGLIEKQPTLVQEPQPQMSLNDHPTQQLVADGSASEERLKAQDSSPPSKLSLAGYVPDTWPENPDLNIDTSKSFDDMDDSLRKLASHSPRLPKRTPAWHTLPFCVKDPFIRKKIVTQAVGHKILELFKKNCQRVARMLSQGASLDELVICKRKGKGPQKISKRKIAPGPGSHMTSPPVVSELQELRADFIPGKDHEVLTPETRQRYPGAVALGPVEYASSVFELDNQDDELDTEALEVPDYPVQTLPEFEEEGFGLKDKYFSMARSPDEDTDQPLGGAVGSERSEELEMGHTLSQCDQGAFTPPSEAEAPSAGSGGQLLPEQDSVGASGSGPAQRLVDEACSGI
ncbi:hypothetical protein PILCRDRAFT_635010 [Piloderma croceum F 1598]|uniref:PAP-associated domain-containing protein n=1 Tax=Piloderma croceum (strain F 1598) TaxID=765440 RepID=A0A0C3ASK2_PILCF|nr:hypothetical protein PILCRDRAFT_635010 [Piloderma croceum F 1598]